MSPTFTRRTARLDATIVARLSGLHPLRYADGGAPGDDRPAHVRAASAVRRRGARLVIVQDDVNVLALHGEDGAEGLLLPAGEGGLRAFGDERGNKHAKMDLEACAVLPDGRLLAMGSGSTTARDRLVLLGTDGAVRVIDARAWFDALRAEPRFAGSELNVEGALVVGDALRLFQRGNGAARDGREPINAWGDWPLDEVIAALDGGGPPPRLRSIVEVELGAVEGARWGFTDAALAPDGRVVFVACAEASPDAVRDGEVRGAAFGVIDADDLRLAPIHEAGGAPTLRKIEGLDARLDASFSFDVVVDMDRHDTPAELGRLDVVGA